MVTDLPLFATPCQDPNTGRQIFRQPKSLEINAGLKTIRINYTEIIKVPKTDGTEANVETDKSINFGYNLDGVLWDFWRSSEQFTAIMNDIGPVLSAEDPHQFVAEAKARAEQAMAETPVEEPAPLTE